jgi:hypothetical protein
LWRWPKCGVVLLFVLILLAVIAVHVDERILRHRAEGLLEDIRSLELRKASFADAQAVFQRWRRWAKYDGECTETHCDIRITLQDFPLDLPEKYAWRMNWPRHASMLVAGHPARVMAEVSVENRIVWGKSFYIANLAPAYSGAPGLASINEYTVIGTVSSRSRFSNWEWDEGGAYFHSNYSIVVPSACEVCVGAVAAFTPFADSRDVQRLMQFDFSCLTRWTTCRMPVDIMPVAMSEYSADKARMTMVPPSECGRDRLDLAGRDSENVAIVDVVANGNQATGDRDGDRDFDLRLVKRIKRAEFWDAGADHNVRFFESQARLVGSSGLNSIHPGLRLIIFFGNSELGGVTLDDCGTLPFTPENLAIVTRSARQDYGAFLQEHEK